MSKVDLTNWLIKKIAGRGLADELDIKLETKRLERKYAHVEPELQKITTVEFERFEGIAQETIFERTECPSVAQKPLFVLTIGDACGNKETFPIRQHSLFSKLLRQLEYPLVEPEPSLVSSSSSPDISRFDLPELQYTSSEESVGTKVTSPMPSFGPMVGFGRYRRSIYADAEWQLDLFRKSFCHIPELVDQLGDFELAQPDPEVWEQFRREAAAKSRANSSGTTPETSTNEIQLRELVGKGEDQEVWFSVNGHQCPELAISSGMKGSPGKGRRACGGVQPRD